MLSQRYWVSLLPLVRSCLVTSTLNLNTSKWNGWRELAVRGKFQLHFRAPAAPSGDCNYYMLNCENLC